MDKFFDTISSALRKAHSHPFYPFLGTGVLICIFSFYYFFISAPSRFPVGSLVTVEEGATLTDIAENLKSSRALRSSLAFRVLVEFMATDKRAVAGDYFFSKPRNVFGVADRISSGEFGLMPSRVRIPEGATRFEIADIMEHKFGRFDADEFVELTEGKEGYLFPDTYFFLPNVEAPEVAKVMEDNFYAHLTEIQEEFELSEKPISEIVVMASLLEKEAYDLETMRMISGILWKRLEIDMPLQVDAVFLYINGKNTYELTLDDLATTSPYNTYKHKGLPPGAIANPGLNALLAAVTPPKTDFLFYLSDRDGNTYYSRTFEEHRVYKDRYVY